MSIAMSPSRMMLVLAGLLWWADASAAPPIPSDPVPASQARPQAAALEPDRPTLSGESRASHFPAFSRTDFSSNFYGGFGYRQDDLEWNIAGNISGANPNVLSELNWEDLGIFQIKGSNTTIVRGLYLKGYLAYGWILSGDNRDSDYLGNDRTLEFSRSNNNADHGNTLDASFAIGYQLLFNSGCLGITPVAGYSYHEQNLRITEGNQTVTAPGGVPLGPFPGLDSAYDAEWKGPWVGVDLSFRSPSSEPSEPPGRYALDLGLEYHWAGYSAVADWNLRTDFAHPKSFAHDADGHGVVVSGDLNVCISDRWAVNFSASYQRWNTDPGTDRLFFPDGTSQTTRLNDVDWRSYAFMLGAAYRF